MSLAGASPVESRGGSRLRYFREPLGTQLLSELDALDPAGARGWGSGPGREGKLIPASLPRPAWSAGREPQLAAWPAQFCQFLKPSWLRSKTKQPNPSLTQVLSCKTRWCAGVAHPRWAAEGNKLAFFARRHLRARNTMATAGRSRLAMGLLQPITLGFICTFSKRKMGIKGFN